MDAGTIITLVISAIAIFAGGYLAVAKKKLSKVVKLGQEAIEVASHLNAALEDNKVTDEEIADLKKQLQDVKDAWKDLISKEPVG